MASKTAAPSSPVRTVQDNNTTTASIDSPSLSDQSNTELLSSLQNRAQVFNQLWQAVEKVQGESISIATWKAKLKELEDAKNANKKLSNELKNSSGRNAELITHNAALMASREELNRELGLREGRIEGLGSQLATARDEIATASNNHQNELGKEQRAKALTAAELRDKIAEVLNCRGQITELVSEMQSLKTELLRSKEISRINTEGIRSELVAAKEHVIALEIDKKSISSHLWNVTDEIKKLAIRNEKAELLSQERLEHLETTRLKFTTLQTETIQKESEYKHDINKLRSRNEELSDELRNLRRQKDQWELDSDQQTIALRNELGNLQVQLNKYEKERKGLMHRTEKAETNLIETTKKFNIESDENKLKLSDERTAHRELRKKMENELNLQRNEIQTLNKQLIELEAARSNQAMTLDELRATILKGRERIRELEHASEESDLAMGSVRKKLEQHLQKARREIKSLTEVIDSTNVKHAEEMEQLLSRLRSAEELLLEKTNEQESLNSIINLKNETLTSENYQLRETVGKQNNAIVAERNKSDQLKQANDILKNETEREVAGVQGELSRALEQAVKDSDKSRSKNEEQRKTMNTLETEKREILQEASKLNSELGIQLNEVKNLRNEIERNNEKEEALKKELNHMKSNIADGGEMRNNLENQLKELRREDEIKLRQHAETLESARKELKFAQKEAAQRVAKFSEHGRAMASDIERLTSKQTELITNLEQRELELKKKTITVKELQARVSDVKKLRSEVAGDLENARNSLKEERANCLALRDEKELLMKALDVEKQSRTSGDQSLKVALRQQKKAQRDMAKCEKEKLNLSIELEKEKNVVPPLQSQIRMQTQQIKEIEEKMKNSVVRHDVAESRAKKQAAELSRDIEQLRIHVQNARDSTDVELRKRLQVEKEAKEFEGEAQKTVSELIRQLKESKAMKERGEEQLQQQLDTQLEYSSTLKRERDRQIDNSKTAAGALREDAETQRRLAGLLEKEKTELKGMLQEKWKEARHLKDRLEEAEAKLYEASNQVDNWQQTKRDLELTVDKQKRRLQEVKTQANTTEDRLGAELKDATSRASQMAAELTTLKHSSLWNDRELGNKVALLSKEIEVLHGQMSIKDNALDRAQQSEIHLKGVAEELKGAAEAMAGDMRTQMKSMNDEHTEHVVTLRNEMKALRERSLVASESMNRMKLEVRARRLESESLGREVKSVAAGSDENARNLEKAEESRSALLNELDRTRQDKTDMVKAMVEERNSAADEAGALQRNISGLNARIRSLTDDLEQSNRARKSLRSNLRRQVINELRGAGWTAPQGYGGNDSDEDNYIGSGKKNKNGKKDAKKKIVENPIAKMRRLREALTQSGSSSSPSAATSSPSRTTQENQQQQKKKNGKKFSSTKKNSSNGSNVGSNDGSNEGSSSRPGSSGQGSGVPPRASASSTPNMTPPPSTPETNSHSTSTNISTTEQQMIASDLGSPIDIIDRNPRDIGFEPPNDGSSSMDEGIMDERDLNGGTPVENSMNRTERFLEKRRKRDNTLQQQVDKDRVKRESRESIHEQQVGRKAGRTSSREKMKLPGI